VADTCVEMQSAECPHHYTVGRIRIDNAILGCENARILDCTLVVEYLLGKGKENMKRITLTLLVIAIPVVGRAQQTQVATIKQEATKCAKALLAGDYETLVKYTHKRVVELVGGKEKVIASVKEGTSKMRADGIELLDATIGQPNEPKRIGSWLIALVPQHVVVKVPAGRLHQDSHLLGISEDDGKSWVFVDISPLTKEQFAKVFPELDGKVSLPEKKKPELRKDD